MAFWTEAIKRTSKESILTHFSMNSLVIISYFLTLIKTHPKPSSYLAVIVLVSMFYFNYRNKSQISSTPLHREYCVAQSKRSSGFKSWLQQLEHGSSQTCMVRKAIYQHPSCFLQYYWASTHEAILLKQQGNVNFSTNHSSLLTTTDCLHMLPTILTMILRG